MSVQPIPVRASRARPNSEPADRSKADLHRMLQNWQRVAARLIATQAHPGLDNELELLDLLGSVEAAIQDRHPAAWPAIEPALAEALLAAEHESDVTSASACLLCRRLPKALAKLAVLTEANGGAR